MQAVKKNSELKKINKQNRVCSKILGKRHRLFCLYAVEYQEMFLLVVTERSSEERVATARCGFDGFFYFLLQFGSLRSGLPAVSVLNKIKRIVVSKFPDSGCVLTFN